jgi:hypothetical protein
VSIEAFTIKYSTGDGVWNGLQPNWAVEDTDLSWAHTAKLCPPRVPGYSPGTSTPTTGAKRGHGGTGSAALRVLGGEYDHNNTEDYLSTSSSAGEVQEDGDPQRRQRPLVRHAELRPESFGLPGRQHLRQGGGQPRPRQPLLPRNRRRERLSLGTDNLGSLAR